MSSSDNNVDLTETETVETEEDNNIPPAVPIQHLPQDQTVPSYQPYLIFLFWT